MMVFPATQNKIKLFWVATLKKIDFRLTLNVSHSFQFRPKFPDQNLTSRKICREVQRIPPKAASHKVIKQVLTNSIKSNEY